MESVLKLFPNIISNVEFLDVYLGALDEHASTNVNHSETTNVLQTITTLLSTAAGRQTGVKVLNKMIGWLPAELIGSKLHLWTTFLLKSCNSNQLEIFGDLTYDALRRLAIFAQQPDLSKSFITNHLPKIYEAIVMSPQKYLLSALKCAEVYLRIFAGPSGQSKGTLLNLFKKFVDTDDERLNKAVGRCLLLMQQVGGGGSNGINYKNQWKQYQLELLGSLNEILDQFFINATDFYNNSTSANRATFDIPAIELNSEPTLRFAQLSVRFQNLSTYLEIALKCPFPVSKSMQPKKILDMIKRGVRITYSRLNKNVIYDNIALGLFLPGLQKKLFQILNSLIHTLRGNLRSYYDTIFGSLIHVLKSTCSTKNSELSKKPLKSLRTEAYKSILIWCKTLKEGSCCELFAEELIIEIFSDIIDIKHDVVLQVQLNTQKGSLKTPIIRQTEECQDETKSSQDLCVAALHCLQELLMLSGSLLKPNCVKLIHINILKIAASFSVLNNKALYKSWQCRLEVIKVLRSLILYPHHKCPPPTDIILFILYQAQKEDPNSEMGLLAKRAISQIEKCIHPQKESLVFPIDIRDIKNSFLQLGQEGLLCEPLLLSKHVNSDLAGEKRNSIEADEVNEESLSIIDNSISVAEELQYGYESIVPSQALNNTEDIEEMYGTLADVDKRLDVLEKSINHIEDVTEERMALQKEIKVVENNKVIESKHVKRYKNVNEEGDDDDDTKLCTPSSAKRHKSDPETKQNVVQETKTLPNENFEDELLADMEAAFVEEFKSQ